MIHLASEKTRSSLSQFDANQVQPNAIDLKVDRIFAINDGTFRIDENEKKHRGSKELKATHGGYWLLKPGTYEILMEGEITIGPDEAGWVITRSTLNRNGLFITSGLYDSGYQGVMAGALHVNVGEALIARGTRVAQFLLFKSESLSSYDGDYGTGKADQTMYQTETYLHHQEYKMATSPEEQKIYDVRRTD